MRKMGFPRDRIQNSHKFSHVFEDETGKERKSMIEDWKKRCVFNYFNSSDGDEQKAVDRVKAKY